MWLRWPLVAFLGLLAVHSGMYGAGFVADPGGMAQEFGATPTPPSEAAQHLTGLIGVMMLLMAAASALAAYWVGRFACREGRWLTGGLAVVTLAIGAYWFAAGSAWDAWFYSLYGLVLGGLSFALQRQMAAADDHDGAA